MKFYQFGICELEISISFSIKTIVSSMALVSMHARLKSGKIVNIIHGVKQYKNNTIDDTDLIWQIPDASRQDGEWMLLKSQLFVHCCVDSEANNPYPPLYFQKPVSCFSSFWV